MNYNISTADASAIFAESITFRKYRFDTIANAIVQNHHMRDNKIASIKMYRDIVSTIAELPTLLDSKQAIERAISLLPNQEPF